MNSCMVGPTENGDSSAQDDIVRGEYKLPAIDIHACMQGTIIILDYCDTDNSQVQDGSFDPCVK